MSEGGVAAGVRRIEAITGDNALAWVQNQSALLAQVAGMLRSTPADLPTRISQVQDQVKQLEKDLEQSRSKLAASAGNDLASSAAVEVKGIKLLAASIGAVSYTHLEPLRVICVFNPPLTGQEVHDKEGVYALPEAQAQAA